MEQSNFGPEGRPRKELPKARLITVRHPSGKEISGFILPSQEKIIQSLEPGETLDFESRIGPTHRGYFVLRGSTAERAEEIASLLDLKLLTSGDIFDAKLTIPLNPGDFVFDHFESSGKTTDVNGLRVFAKDLPDEEYDFLVHEVATWRRDPETIEKVEKGREEFAASLQKFVDEAKQIFESSGDPDKAVEDAARKHFGLISPEES